MVETRFERLSRVGLRSAMVVIFFVFGLQKFTAIEANAIVPSISNSPLMSWMTALGTRGESRVIGCVELTVGVLLATELWRERASTSILGAAGSCLTFLTTLSFLLSTPMLFAPQEAPVLNANGLFLVKDLVLLAASVLLLAHSLHAHKSA